MKNTGHGINGDGGTRTLMNEELQVSTVIEQKRALKANWLMERVVEEENLTQARKRVMNNNGAAGIDNMRAKELDAWLMHNKHELMRQLLSGTYEPMPVRRVDIPKPKGGTRQLGIPTVVDRLVQQAMMQVLSSILDPRFSESSYGFRPGRSAHQALKKAEEYVGSGRKIVVDIDLEKFFDNVNHDILMARLARHIEDKRMLRIVRKFLQAGIMQNGVCTMRNMGTPQGGPLSPLLANLMLDDLDKELEKRGHKFCRYADDCNIYVYTKVAGERVMASVEEFLGKRLRLKINKDKSQVSPCSAENFSWVHNTLEWYAHDSEREH
jgi:RNA-directed DNA polymerase